MSALLSLPAWPLLLALGGYGTLLAGAGLVFAGWCVVVSVREGW